MKAYEFITEKWSQKYKSSINCSHPKGFSQRAHCAGRKKHNESTEMEMVCEDCGMCKTHGNINEIKKGQKDSNGYTRCWPGKHAEGTKKGKNGGQVRNCVPNESVAESFIRDGADWENALRELNVFNDVFLSPDIQDTHEYTRDPEWQDLSKMIRNSARVQEIYGQLKKFANLGVKLTSFEVNLLDPLVWDGGGDMDIDRLGDLYAHQLGAVEALLKTKNRGQGPNKTKSGQTIHEQGDGNDVEVTSDDQTETYRYKGWQFIETANDYYSGEAWLVDPNGNEEWFGYQTDDNRGIRKYYNDQDQLAFSLSARDEGQSTEKWLKAQASNWADTWNAQPNAPAVHESNELAEEFDLIESIIDQIAAQNGVDSEVVWDDLESLTEDELYAFAVTSQLNEDWQKVNKKDRTAGMSQKAVNAYRRENPGSKLKTAVTTKPSKLKKGSKASKRRKSYCSRSRGQMKMHNISCAKTPDKAICKARRRWNC